MRIPHALGLATVALALSSTAVAEVKELDGEEMVGSFVGGISISTPVTDKPFDQDDEDMREVTTEQRNALGVVAPELAVSNAEALTRTPDANQMIGGISDEQTRDLVEDTITQTSLSTRLDVNLDRVASSTGEPVSSAASQDFSVLRGSILELLPSATGYQLEFMKNRY